MPEIKNTFLQGKMNKDLDERLIPKGQYRNAVNVEVSTAEDSSVGTVKNILGNKRIEQIVPEGFSCVGSVADEKTNKLYWFISSYETDAILEYDAENDVQDLIFVDTYASNSNAVLKFSGNMITGINIIDDLLFWTDNNSEPKKINITNCRAGTTDINTHTQMTWDTGSFWGIGIDMVQKTSGNIDLTTTPTNHVGGRYAWFEKVQMDALLQQDSYNDSHIETQIRHYRDGTFIGLKDIRLWTSNWDANNNPYNPNATNGTHFRSTPYVNTVEQETEYKQGDVIFGNNVSIDYEERHVTVIKPKPVSKLKVKINYEPAVKADVAKIPNLFEEKFPRFSYRYKYRDGEFSPMAPFTDPVFNPAFPRNINKSTEETNIFYNRDNAYDVSEGYNKAMINSIHSVDLMNFVNSQIPEDVVEIDILYKQEDSPNVYSIDTIKHSDYAWHAPSDHEDGNSKFDLPWHEGRDDTIYSIGSLTKGKYNVTTENIYAALPANQLLRPWDNVPRRALGQDMTGNRIVYGNYVQNYNFGNFKHSVSLSTIGRDTLKSFDTGGLPSIKSERNYQAGIVYCDKYGRETPVFTSSDGAIHVPWSDENNNKNASKSNQLQVSTLTKFPAWVDHIKFFIKEDSNDYYNLLMDRAWVQKTTYELDNSEKHLWISFPSSDRNKVSEGDYISLKKSIGVGLEQSNYNNKFKVLGIEDAAPDAIKYKMVNKSAFSGDAVDEIFGHETYRIDKQTDKLYIHIDNFNWSSTLVNGDKVHGGGLTIEGESGTNQSKGKIDGDLYVSWRKLDASGRGAMSKRYNIKEIMIGSTYYVCTLSSKITKTDADLAHTNGDSVNGNNGLDLHDDLLVQIERKELKDTEDFSGKFFVKIAKNQVTNMIESGHEVDLLDRNITIAKQNAFWWRDDVAGGTADSQTYGSGTGYGLTNYNGYFTSLTGDEAVQSNNNANVSNQSASGQTLRVMDYHVAWANLHTRYGGGTWFIDSMHVKCSQSLHSDYAKYGGINWSGSIPNPILTFLGWDVSSSWRYPGEKMWITDWLDSDTAPSEAINSDSTIYRRSIEANWMDHSPVCKKDTEYGSDTIANQEAGEGLRLTGWVGPSQNVQRIIGTFGAPTQTEIDDRHVNGMEGIVTTGTDHASGCRRWYSGLGGDKTSSSVGSPTRTYSQNGETGRHFIHLSFFAPGKDLIDPSKFPTNFELFGNDSVGENLQGVWGGGVFTLKKNFMKTGIGSTSDDRHMSICMEGNNLYSDGNRWLSQKPGPGVGFGYDVKYRELFERQWDPTFTENGDPDDKIKEFINKLIPGSRFKFSTDSTYDPTIYTIKQVHVKKFYNHTSWRENWNRFDSTQGSLSQGYKLQGQNSFTGDNLENSGFDVSKNVAYKSVEQCALEWLACLGSDGDGASGTYTNSEQTNLKNKLAQFGAAHNRRVCYIIEIDKDPVASGNYNPLSSDMHADRGQNGAGLAPLDNDWGGSNIEFLEETETIYLSELNKYPAIWETSPKKIDTDLDIYYEASSSIPIKLNNNTNAVFAPIGCRVELLGIDQEVKEQCWLAEWHGKVARLNPGYIRGDGMGEIDYSGAQLKFIRKDGSYTIATCDENQLIGEVTGMKTDFNMREDVGDSIKVGLGWYNCFSFGNGIESNRIKDDFNEMIISTGVKASTTIQETYEQERRSHGLIYSGLYNSNSGINDLNQFIMAEKITKDLNPTYGSIQKLFSRDSDLVTFCEDKVVKILANKDALFNADGNTNLTATENVLGQTVPFIGEYGISKNPESFASESYRAYFTDQQRGAVLRLSRDGLTPISDAGMHDWFRDNLKLHGSLVGTFDKYKQNFNLHLSHAYAENLIVNEFFDEGESSIPLQGSLLNHVVNETPTTGTSFQFLYESNNLKTDPLFSFGSVPDGFDSTVTVKNHAEIPVGHFQTALSDDFNTTTTTTTVDDPSVPFIYPQYKGHGSGVSYQPGTSAGMSGAGAAGWHGDTCRIYRMGGNWYGNGNPTGTNTSASQSNDFRPGDSIFGPSWGPVGQTTGIGRDRYRIRRFVNHTEINESNIQNGYEYKTMGDPALYGGTTASNLSGIYPTTATKRSENLSIGHIGDVSTQHQDYVGKNWHFVMFNRVPAPDGGGAYLHISPGEDYTVNAQIDLDNASTNYDDNHYSCYAGEEIVIMVSFMTFMTGINTNSDFGYNKIKPWIELYDGMTPVSDACVFIPTGPSTGVDFSGASDNPLLHYGSNPIQYPLTSFRSNNSIVANSEDQWLDRYTYASQTNGVSYYDQSHQCLREYVNSTFQSFPGTYADCDDVSYTDVTNIYGKMWNNPPDDPRMFYQVGFKVKFKDPNLTTAQLANADDNDATLTKVIDNLNIRIGQNHASAEWYSQYSHAYILGYPLWAVTDVLIKKLVYAVDPGQVQGTMTQTTTTTTQTQWARPNVPATAVPAWVEVAHGGFTDWDETPASSGGTYKHANTSSQWGNSVAAINDPSCPVSLQNADNTPNGTATWIIPNGPPAGQTAQPYPHPMWPTVANGIQNPSVHTTTHDNLFYHVRNATNDYTRIRYTMSEPFVADNWYLVDIEYDNSYTWGSAQQDAVGTGSGDGEIHIVGVQSAGSFVSGTLVDQGSERDSIGTYVTGMDGSHDAIKTHQVTRTEYGNNSSPYGDNRIIQRAIFQIKSDSQVMTDPDFTNATKIVFDFAHFDNAARIQSIIVKDITVVGSTTGLADSWKETDVYGPHALSLRSTYFQNNMLCVEQSASSMFNSVDGWAWWEQNFEDANAPIPTRPRPLTTPDGWKFSFTISDNPRTNDFFLDAGESIVGNITNMIGDSSNSGEMEGIRFSGIDSTGDYNIYFNMDGSVNGNTGWYATKMIAGVETAYPNITLSVPSSGYLSTSSNEKIIRFGSGGTGFACRFAASNFILMDQTIVYQGGSSGNWMYNGFNTSLDNYIVWDDTVDNRIDFNQMPLIDPNPSTPGVTQLISAGQWINKTINRYENYKVKFSHGITSGVLHIYYFNNAGYGFRIANINSTSGNVVGNHREVEVDVTIGDEVWDPINPVNSSYLSEMKETFVIRMENDSVFANVNGWIDGVSMVRTFDTSSTPKTITFREDVNGWVSFKTWVPESGLSLSKEYFTFNDGKLYKHYVPLKYNQSNGFWEDSTAEDADNYNRWYDSHSIPTLLTSYQSKVTLVINDEPSTVKSFNTLNYEGSQRRIIAQSFLDNNNAQAWVEGQFTPGYEIKGWYCENIKTDLENGSVIDFIEKEGKKFSYIKGDVNEQNNIENPNLINMSKFSSQGIGTIANWTPVTI